MKKLSKLRFFKDLGWSWLKFFKTGTKYGFENFQQDGKSVKTKR